MTKTRYFGFVIVALPLMHLSGFLDALHATRMYPRYNADDKSNLPSSPGHSVLAVPSSTKKTVEVSNYKTIDTKS